jgi:CDP-diacylglycerol---glycerol-3-phosphate 3-phosphatidyltransferase
LMLVCQLPVWWFVGPVAIIINREIAVSALRAWMAEKNEVATVKVSWIGKSKTALQMISTLLLLLSCTPSIAFDLNNSLGLGATAIFKAGLGSFYTAGALTIISGFQYFHAAWPILIKSV